MKNVFILAIRKNKQIKIMKKITIEATPTTPYINLDPEAGLIEISGRSIPENASIFFEEFIEGLKEYANSPAKETVFRVSFEYCNTSSGHQLLRLSRILNDIHLENKSKVKFEWCHEETDEDMKEAGVGFKALVDFDFELIPLAD